MIVLLLSGIYWLGCQSGKKNAIEGTYFQHTESEFGIADDTLKIAHVAGNSYQIERSTGSRSVLDGKLMGKKYRKKSWQADDDGETGMLRDNAYGFSLRVLPDSQVVYLGTIRFSKIN